MTESDIAKSVASRVIPIMLDTLESGKYERYVPGDTRTIICGFLNYKAMLESIKNAQLNDILEGE